MATAKITKKDMQQDEFIEGIFDFGEWLEVHWKQVAIALGAIVAIILAGIGFNSMRQRSAEEANRVLTSGLEAFSPTPGADGQTPPPRYAEALPLFEQAAGKGGKVGDIGHLFHARTLIALSRGNEAVSELEDLVKSGSEGLAAEAKLALAQIAEDAKDFDRAAALLQGMGSAEKGAYPPDGALLLLGNLRERQGKTDDAKKAYDDLLTRFPQSAFADEARQRVSELTKTPR
jgi:predicted negative regulator of RcsB-dependent stress response